MKVNLGLGQDDTGLHLLEIKEKARIIRFLNKQEHLKGEID